MSQSFGQYVRALRESAGLSQRALAGRLGVSIPYLWRVEAGERDPFPPTRWAPLEEIGADPEQLKALAMAAAIAKVSARVAASRPLPNPGNGDTLTP